MTLIYSDGTSQEGEIVRLTATELEVFNSIYLRIDNEQKGIVDITEINDVSGTYQGHDYVDLGLPSGTLWATMNVGAKKRRNVEIVLDGEKQVHT